MKMTDKRGKNKDWEPSCSRDCKLRLKTKCEVFGEEILEKTVTKSGKSGRVYLPLEWLGKTVKVIRLN